MEISFLILNYNNYVETFNCIDSIYKLNISKWNAVVVDNGSSDGSYDKLVEKYNNDNRIVVIHSEKNLGFSAGNNLGYAYIRENYSPDFVVVTNNDILFPDVDFANKLMDIYKKTDFYVYGPDIYVRANYEHQSPIMLNFPTLDQLRQELKMYEYYQANPKKWAKRRTWQDMKNRVCQRNKVIEKIYNKLKRKQTIDRASVYENVCVQGACIIVSSKYLKAETSMFSPETFLYCEELLLYHKCLKKGYKVIYDPYIQVWHEDSATMKKINVNRVERAVFTLKHHVEARRKVVDYLETGDL